MRRLLVLVVLVAGLLIAGWIRFSMQDGNPTIQIDSDKVKQDTSTIIDKAKQTIDDAKSEVEKSSANSGATPPTDN